MDMTGAVVGQDAVSLSSVLEKIYRYDGHDFRNYKHGTLTRRLARRLYAVGSGTYREYIQFLDRHPEEYPKLIDYLTIKVSGFFRNSYSFKRMADRVLSAMVSYKEKTGERAIRFWSSACARGEEPYSIAVMLNEFLGQRRNDFDILIYATDISQSALNEAQAGKYSLENIKGLSPEITRKYFVKQGQCYEVKDSIRQMVNFSRFDLTSNAQTHFTGLDCIFCCNVLIYLRRQTQDRVLNRLYESLTVPGYLVLGKVETLTSGLNEKMECLDSEAKIYKKDTGGDDV